MAPARALLDSVGTWTAACRATLAGSTVEVDD
jgi:hypothetical protein